MKTFKLKGGNKIPALGFGTWELRGENCKKAVKTALSTGYRHIDTADMYQNHREVGQAIKESKISRKDIFLTTKLWPNMLAKEKVKPAVERFLEELQVEYVDLLLIHWPTKHTPIKETLSAMNDLIDIGLVKSIGLSNFTIDHLKEALKTKYPASVNQVEFHPTLNQTKLKDFCDKNDIHITAYSPIGRGNDLDLEMVKDIAKSYNATPAQIILAWQIKKGMSTIPKAQDKDHIKENYKSLDIKLKKKDVEKIDSIDTNNRLVNPSFSPF